MKATVDTREFNAALKAAAKVSSRTMQGVVVGQALALSKRSLKHTEKADSNKIAQELGQTGTKLRKRKADGRVVKGARVYGGEGTFAARIINTKRKKSGKKPIFGEEMRKEVKRFIAKRIRGAGFIRSGWIWPIRDLAQKVGFKDRRKVRKTKARPIKPPRVGSARFRKHKSTPLVEIINTALNTKSKGNPVPVARKGLVAGMRETIADMRAHTAKRLQRELKRFSA